MILFDLKSTCYFPGGGGTPLYAYMGYIGMSSPEGQGFSTVLVINRISIFGHFAAILVINRVSIFVYSY